MANTFNWSWIFPGGIRNGRKRNIIPYEIIRSPKEILWQFRIFPINKISSSNLFWKFIRRSFKPQLLAQIFVLQRKKAWINRFEEFGVAVLRDIIQSHSKPLKILIQLTSLIKNYAKPNCFKNIQNPLKAFNFDKNGYKETKLVCLHVHYSMFNEHSR